MLQEMKLEDALKKFLQGKKVLVAPARAMDSGKERYLFRSLESILNEKRFLVEVAAVEKPDFKAAVHQMVTPKKTAPQETIQEEPEVAPMEINKEDIPDFCISAVSTVVRQRPSVQNISLVITAVKNAVRRLT